MFTGQYADVWNKVCRISCLNNISLLHIFDNHIQNISYVISANISDIGMFLLLNIGIGISPKNPISVGPYSTPTVANNVFLHLILMQRDRPDAMKQVVKVCFKPGDQKFKTLTS